MRAVYYETHGDAEVLQLGVLEIVVMTHMQMVLNGEHLVEIVVQSLLLQEN